VVLLQQEALELQHEVFVPHDLVVSQELVQHTMLQTPHVNTATNIAFKAKSIQSFQQFQFSHFILFSFIFQLNPYLNLTYSIDNVHIY